MLPSDTTHRPLSDINVSREFSSNTETATPGIELVRKLYDGHKDSFNIWVGDQRDLMVSKGGINGVESTGNILATKEGVVILDQVTSGLTVIDTPINEILTELEPGSISALAGFVDDVLKEQVEDPSGELAGVKRTRSGMLHLGDPELQFTFQLIRADKEDDLRLLARIRDLSEIKEVPDTKRAHPMSIPENLKGIL
ncbi:MAG: hypothetical protein UT34_C0002G0283 [candidate division WS6 bacterium GW2011_GWF2_39_15]|uniref:Uncharacterized protein n=1 Tax=candidate division WS6 bacterium GW2011_GWF2_39_15 TaxID=1619100 RepID=A0A0G0MYY4_9BACT|nr:MAG: hypothetical protein UT34_C0002G0283 [candidate division WS6 bacterium GW2011_GWF2_39_15]